MSPSAATTQPARVLCHLGGVTNLAIAAGPICLFTRPLQTVWSADDESVVSSLAEEIRLSLDFHMAQPNATPVNSIVLSGPGATDELVANELGGPYRSAGVGRRAARRARHPHRAQPRGPGAVHRRGRSGPWGGGGMRAINLLPVADRVRGPAKVPDRASHLVLGVLGGLVVAVLAVVVTQNQITDRTREIAEAKQEQQSAEQRSAASEPSASSPRSSRPASPRSTSWPTHASTTSG